MPKQSSTQGEPEFNIPGNQPSDTESSVHAAEPDSTASGEPSSDRPGNGLPTDGTGDESEALLAPHGLRLVAFLIDMVVVALAFGLAWIYDSFTEKPPSLAYLAAGIIFVYYLAATVWLLDGQTAGKAVCCLRVRRINGELTSDSLRGLLWSFGRHSVGYLIADVLLLGTLAAFFTPRRRCLHDVAFGSEVVLVGTRDAARSPGHHYKEFMKTLVARYEEVGARNRWMLFPVIKLAGVLMMTAELLEKLLPLFEKVLPADASSPAASTPAATTLSAKGGASLWAATTALTVMAVGSAVVFSRTLDDPELVLAGPSTSELTITTYDSLTYDFRAVGDFVLAKSTKDDFEVQGRTAIIPVPETNPQTTAVRWTAIAANVEGTRVEIRAVGGVLPVLIDGERATPEDGLIKLPGGGKIQETEVTTTIRWPHGSEAIVQSSTTSSLTWELTLPNGRKGAVVGLLGDGDGDPNNDLAGSDGAVVPPPKPSPRPRYQKRFNQEFLVDWLVKDSLFS